MSPPSCPSPTKPRPPKLFIWILSANRRNLLKILTAGQTPLVESQRLCVHLLDRAMTDLEAQGWQQETVLGVFDLRGFTSKNADLGFIRFLVSFRAANTVGGLAAKARQHVLESEGGSGRQAPLHASVADL